MARRTFEVIDIVEILVHWYAGRSDPPRLDRVWLERPHDAAVSAVAFSGDEYLVSGSGDRSVTLFALSPERFEVSGTRRLLLTLQCAGMKIDGVKGEREYDLLSEALAKADRPS